MTRKMRGWAPAVRLHRGIGWSSIGAVLPAVDPVEAAVLALLEREHGIGARQGRHAEWLGQRLRRAIAALAEVHLCAAAEVPRLLAQDRALLAALADELRVGETSFYRDPTQWSALRSWLRGRSGGPGPARGQAAAPLRGLSVGCSTGEEAYTLAMVLEEARPAAGGARWSVVGVDRSGPALGGARAGEYPTALTRPLPPELVALGLERSGGGMRVRPVLRRGTTFVERDVTRGLPPGRYEIVLCKNVLIYFGDVGGDELVDALERALAPNGLLLVARSEVARVRTLGLRPVDLGAGVTAFSQRGGSPLADSGRQG